MVHQYFYSQRSLYILMDSSRSGANEYDSRLNQLLQSAELFGRNSQMLLIQNEHTGHQKNMDFSVLKKNYPFLTEMHSVNLYSKEGLDKVKAVIKEHIAKIPGMGVRHAQALDEGPQEDPTTRQQADNASSHGISEALHPARHYR